MSESSAIPPITEFYECFRSATNVLHEGEYCMDNRSSTYSSMIPLLPALPTFQPPCVQNNPMHILPLSYAPYSRVYSMPYSNPSVAHNDILYDGISPQELNNAATPNLFQNPAVNSHLKVTPKMIDIKPVPITRGRPRGRKMTKKVEKEDESKYEDDESDSEGGRRPRRRTPTIAQRSDANIRERRRMNNLNTASEMLRKRVPTFAYEKHLTRIETLRLAIGYINFMTDLLTVVNPREAHQKYANAAHEMTVKWSADV